MADEMGKVSSNVEMCVLQIIATVMSMQDACFDFRVGTLGAAGSVALTT